MARARRLAVNTFIRSQVRNLVRSTPQNDAVISEITARFPTVNKNMLRSTVAQERARQTGINTIMEADKRRNVDLGATLKCSGPNQTITASIELMFPDPLIGGERRFQGIVTLDKVGRLATILNTAIQDVIDRAVNRGYEPGTITSANTTGSHRYQINYIECN